MARNVIVIVSRGTTLYLVTAWKTRQRRFSSWSLHYVLRTTNRILEKKANSFGDDYNLFTFITENVLIGWDFIPRSGCFLMVCLYIYATSTLCGQLVGILIAKFFTSTEILVKYFIRSRRWLVIDVGDFEFGEFTSTKCLTRIASLMMIRLYETVALPGLGKLQA